MLFKMKNILLPILILACYFGFGQANITSTGITIQGIAKNIDNSARTTTNISITATLYSKLNNVSTDILSRTATITTDEYGVFNYVFAIDSSLFAYVTRKETWFKIATGNVVFVDEKLGAVAYSLYAQNGVPTGSIMPYAGTIAPAGWLLADGSAIPTDASCDDLRNLYGSNLPNLKGFFLRGIGAQTLSSVDYKGANTVKAIQLDSMQLHNHTITVSGSTNTVDGHSHRINLDRGGSNNRQWNAVVGDAGNQGDERTSLQNAISAAGDHNHSFTVGGDNLNNQANGGNETRPVNYGVNYIIKI